MVTRTKGVKTSQWNRPFIYIYVEKTLLEKIDKFINRNKIKHLFFIHMAVDQGDRRRGKALAGV